jgi:hypothetical protein
MPDLNIEEIRIETPQTGLRKRLIQPEALRLIPEALARKHAAIPLEISGNVLHVAMVNLSDITNPEDNVWNGKSSGLGGQFIDGVDIDTFNVSAPIVNPGDTSAEVSLSTSIDCWNLIYTILSFRSEYGGLIPNSCGIITYKYGN